MPEVIDLLSSTPPPPAALREPSSFRGFHSSPPQPADLGSIQILSDDVDIQKTTYEREGDLNLPSKRRRLTPEAGINLESPRLNHDGLPSRSGKSLFVFSDDIPLSSDGPSNQISKAPAFTLDSDPIVFTSSAPEQIWPAPSSGKEEKNQRSTTSADNVFIVESSKGANSVGANTVPLGHGQARSGSFWKEGIEEFSSDPVRVPDPSELFDFRGGSDFTDSGLGSGLSSRTASLLANLGGCSKTQTQAKTKPDRPKEVDVGEHDADELPEPRSRKLKKATTTAKRITVDKEAKAKDREAAKAQRDHEKQLENERKQKLKEEKAKEKQLAADIAQANKLKEDKKHSTPEMIIDLPSSLRDTSVGTQTVEHMRRLGVEHCFFDSSAKVVKWRRKAKTKFNDHLGYWEPCELHIREEEHVLCHLTAQEFVDMVTSTLNSDTPDAPSELELHVLRLKRIHAGSTVIYLIEGLTAWMRKNTNARNRAYQAELHRNLGEVQGLSSTASSSAATHRKKTNKPADPPPIDDDIIEDALLNLQVAHGCLIHQTAAPPESAEWIKNFTEHISTVPYRRQRIDANDAAFCMDGGQVKPGENKSDTFIRMLQEVNRVTASMAYGVINQYPSVIELVRGMRGSGPAMLEDVKKSANKNGALTDSRIGPAVSRRLYKVFMGLDPNSTDI
ncbi:uncharacterized protein BJX67DRAFT_359388 [Aspergillus lucknowensis]|uniref:ERCC4 domain-containing protein n=1 Tax=Aspergillus lucknowensis TaxID=176173 RepID=A0ABR4LP55_9EURO